MRPVTNRLGFSKSRGVTPTIVQSLYLGTARPMLKRTVFVWWPRPGMIKIMADSGLLKILARVSLGFPLSFIFSLVG